MTLWVTWLAAIAAGAWIGTGLPAWLHLEFVIPLFLIGEVAPKLAQAPQRRAALTAAAVAILALAAPMHLGIAAGTVAGIVAGLAGSNRSSGAIPPATAKGVAR